jgi:DNA-binding response OmpR family regulator
VNLLVIEEILSRNFNWAQASTTEQAVSLAASFKPDLVLIDLLVQDGSGYEICKTLRSNPKLKFTKIILVSTKALLKDRLSGYQAGADDYIARPFDPDELTAKAKVFIRLKSVEEVDRAKDDLINLFSHETRTPLNAIIGFAKLLAETPALPTTKKSS